MTTKIPTPPNTNRFYSTLLSPLDLRHFQLHPRRRGIMGDNPYNFTARSACEGESGQAPEESEGNLKPDPEGGTASVAREGDPTKLEYLTFDPSGMSTIK